MSERNGRSCGVKASQKSLRGAPALLVLKGGAGGGQGGQERHCLERPLSALQPVSALVWASSYLPGPVHQKLSRCLTLIQAKPCDSRGPCRPMEPTGFSPWRARSVLQAMQRACSARRGAWKKQKYKVLRERDGRVEVVEFRAPPFFSPFLFWKLVGSSSPPPLRANQ